MKIYKKILFAIIIFPICITNIYADCSQEEKNEFNAIKDEYKIQSEFNKTTNDYTLYFSMYDRKKFSYRIETGDTLNCSIVDEKTTKCTGVKPNKYDIKIVGKTKTCDEVLKTITLNLKGYNKYSEDPLCEGIEEFVLCQETYDKEIDYDTFVSRINTYKKTKEKQKEETEIEQEENEIKTYIEENYVQIIIIAIFIILLLITAFMTIKSIRKSRRFE